MIISFCLFVLLCIVECECFVVKNGSPALNTARICQNGPLFASFKYSGPLSAGIVSAPRAVPDHILKPEYVADGYLRKPQGKSIVVNSKSIIDRMRVAGRIAREVLDEAVKFVKAGVTTDMIDDLVHRETIKRNSYPSPLMYSGFPKSVCTSLNEIICHGIPDSTILKDGDIINVDVTIYHNGVHGDCSETIMVGNVGPEARRLVLTTFKAWRAAVAHCKPGVPYSEIGKIIEDIVKAEGFTSSRDFCGHGIGEVFHAAPDVLHYANNIDQGVMLPGHIFTIEPMINQGSGRSLRWPDKWTHATVDGKLSAQFENTLLITEDGVEELTGKLTTSPKYSWEES